MAHERTAIETALRADILASSDPEVVAARAIRNDTEMARIYNLNSTFVVWKTSCPVSEYRKALVWTEVDNLTVGKARIWEWITGDMTLPLSPADSAVRAGLAEAWTAASATRPALLAIAKRFATRAERLLVTGTGTNATPGDLVFEGLVTIQQIGHALND